MKYAKWQLLMPMVAFLFPLASSPAWAQSSGTTTADLKGRVSDESGQPLPGASVTATSRETGVSRSTVTRVDGSYSIVLLPPGVYSVKAEMDLFIPAQKPGVTLTLGSTVQIDFAMTLFQKATASIEVTAEAPLIDVTKTDLSQVVNSAKIERLPNVARNYLSFSLTTPRVAEDRSPQSGATSSSGFSINGQSPRLNIVAVDGFDNNDQANGSVRATFSQDAIQEYQVVTTPYAAEYGRAAGGVINIITKSGTNEFHGGAFYFYRGDALSSKDPLTDERIPLEDHRFGGSAGGPLGKDRTFFFMAAERQTTDTAIAVSITDEDVALVRSKGFEIENGNVPYAVDNTNFVLKLDHRFSSSQFLTLRGSWSKGMDENQQQWGGLVAQSAGGVRDSRETAGALGFISIFGASTYNEFRALYSGNSYDIDTLDPITGVSVTLPGVATLGTQRFLPSYRDSKVLQIFDALSLEADSKGRLKLKAGFEYNETTVDGSMPNFFAGLYRFSAIPAGALGPNTPALDVRGAFRGIDGIPLLAGGIPAMFIQAFGDPHGVPTAWNLGVFLQTDLLLGETFLLRIGARWDREAPFGPFASQSNLSPRLSFSFAPSGSVRIKGGLGRFLGVSAIGPMFSVTVLDGVHVRAQTRALGVGSLAASPLVPWNLPDRRFPNEQAAGTGLIPPFILRAGEYESPQTDQVSLGFETTASRGLLASVDGVYSRGRNIFIAHNINPVTQPDAPPALQRPDPRYTDINLFESIGNSWYAAATLGLQTSLGGPFEASLFYTYAKAEDDYIDWTGEYQPEDPLNMANERGSSVQSPDQKLALTATYSTVGRKDLGTFLSDWSLGFIVDWRNGLHYNITAGYDRNRNGDPYSDRPEGYRRNAGSLGSQFSLDVRLARTLLLGKSVSAELAVICTNVTNAKNVLQRNSVFYLSPGVTNPSFGSPTLYGPGRLLQLGARLNF